MSQTLHEFQKRIADIYLERDSARGLEGTYCWFAEEVGELTRALRRGEKGNLEEEFADVLAWLATLASMSGIELTKAVEKYANGCPRCKRTPCACPESS